MALGNDEINDLATRAAAAFNALSLEEQRAHRTEQKVSWVYGEMCLKYGLKAQLHRAGLA